MRVSLCVRRQSKPPFRSPCKFHRERQGGVIPILSAWRTWSCKTQNTLGAWLTPYSGTQFAWMNEWRNQVNLITWSDCVRTYPHTPHHTTPEHSTAQQNSAEQCTYLTPCCWRANSLNVVNAMVLISINQLSVPNYGRNSGDSSLILCDQCTYLTTAEKGRAGQGRAVRSYITWSQFLECESEST